VTRGELTAELAASLGQRHEARFIVEEVLGTAAAGPGQVVTPADLATVRTLVGRRLAGEPLQYVLGHWAFRSLDLVVDPRVLIPRPETEQVVEVALGEVVLLRSEAPAVVDVGTGSGAIALSLATELADRFPAGHVWATDISAEALDVARANLARTSEERSAKMLPVSFYQGSWLSALPADLRGSLDLVVANPPYVATEEYPDLAGEVQQEPYGALVAGAGSEGTLGLADVEQVLEQAWSWLARPGAVVIEMAPGQTDAASRLARSLGYVDVRVEQDLTQRPRALVGRAR
jgi:release factor glutamine methyltransferase